MAETKSKFEGARAFGYRTVANADDFEVLRKTGGHAHDHVIDQGAG